ncbi:MAG: sterol desaturase family protein [Saprospiraceae bacterium]|nr:sterol desaturase family protein [Saprospiraceae bacterium]
MDWQAYITELSKDKLGIVVLPIFVLAILIEVYLARQEQKQLYQGKDTLVSLSMLVFAVIIEFFPKLIAFVAFVFLHEISPLVEVVQRQWWAWTLLFFLDDFSYYWFHRLNHEVRLLWAGHVVHHSSEYLNFGTALRQGVGERLHKYLFWLWLPLLGFDPLMMFTMIGINLLYQFWVHTEMVQKLPDWFEAIFNTPSHHRVHHASNLRYLDCNHAGVLIIWDKIFGTFSEEKEFDQPIYGLTKNISSYNPLYVVSHEFAVL